MTAPRIVDFSAEIYRSYARNAEQFLADEPIDLPANSGRAVIRRRGMPYTTIDNPAEVDPDEVFTLDMMVLQHCVDAVIEGTRERASE
ncbi:MULTISPECIES: hypothetical protein [unclassified Nocardia]|uniref:hypothetical protein n=1 Tax=Nocardia TaxID=1817 RepID=UPI003447FBC1